MNEEIDPRRKCLSFFLLLFFPFLFSLHLFLSDIQKGSTAFVLISAYNNLIKNPSNNQMGMGGGDSLPLFWKEKEAARARQRSGSQPHLFPQPTPAHPIPPTIHLPLLGSGSCSWTQMLPQGYRSNQKTCVCEVLNGVWPLEAHTPLCTVCKIPPV